MENKNILIHASLDGKTSICGENMPDNISTIEHWRAWYLVDESHFCELNKFATPDGYYFYKGKLCGKCKAISSLKE